MAALKFLELLKVTPKEIRSTKNPGRTFRVAEMQGLMHYEDGSIDVFVLDVFDSESMPIDGLKPGRYLPTLDLMPARDSRKLEARIVALRPVPAASVKAAA